MTADRDALGAARDSAAAWGPPAFEATRLADDLAGCFDELVTWAAARAAEATTQAEEAREAEQTAAAEVQTRLAVADRRVDRPRPRHGRGRGRPACRRTNRRRCPHPGRRGPGAPRGRPQPGGVAAGQDRGRPGAGAGRRGAPYACSARTSSSSGWPRPPWTTWSTAPPTGLSELSDGQFTLTHDKGEFFVIDHFDADSRRSVRTLSGGETFQASLALALALSEQLASLGDRREREAGLDLPRRGVRHPGPGRAGDGRRDAGEPRPG